MFHSRVALLVTGLAALTLIGCSDEDSPTRPVEYDQVTWNVPEDISTIAAAADTARQGDLILVSPGIYNEFGIVLDIGVDLRGATGKADDVVIDGQGQGRVLMVEVREGTVPVSFRDTVSNISNLKITGGVADFHGGGGLLLKAPGEVENVRFVGNTTSGSGGGMNASLVWLRMAFCDFDSNSSQGVGQLSGGGGLYVQGGEDLFEISHCEFVGNTAAGSGGGALIKQNGRIAHCIFSDNRTVDRGYHGGGLAYVSDQFGQAVVDTCEFVGNSIPGQGGGLGARGHVAVTGSTFSGNTAENGGGLVGANSVVGCRFTDNEASDLGGAIFAASSEITDSVFANNRSPEGAAVFGNISVSVTDCEFTDHPDVGPVVCWSGHPDREVTVSFERCSFRNNATLCFEVSYRMKASFTDCEFMDNSQVGAVFIEAQVDLTRCVMTGNSTPDRVSVLYLESYEPHGRVVATIVDCIITGNSSGKPRGTILAFSHSDVSANNCTILDNTAPEWPAAFIGSNSTGTFSCCDVLPEEIGGYGTITIVDTDCQ